MKPADLKSTLKSGNPAFGFMLSAIITSRWARYFEGCTLDYCVIDWEHGARDRGEISNLVYILQKSNITAIVRIPYPDPVFVAMALDAGADGVLVPYVESIDDARACANKLRLHPFKGEYLEKATKSNEFPSDKTRNYLSNRHEDHFFILGIESVPGVERLNALLEASNPDGIFVGPNDLSTSLGIPDEVDNPLYLNTLKNIISTGNDFGIPTMIHQQTMESSKTAMELGARWILHSGDLGILLRATQNEFSELRKFSTQFYGQIKDVKLEDTIDTV